MIEINPYEAPQSDLLQRDISTNSASSRRVRAWITPSLAFGFQMLLNIYFICLDQHGGGLESIRIFAPLWFLIPFIAGLGLVLALTRQSWKMVLVQLLVCLCDLFIYLYMVYF